MSKRKDLFLYTTPKEREKHLFIFFIKKTGSLSSSCFVKVAKAHLPEETAEIQRKQMKSKDTDELLSWAHKFFFLAERRTDFWIDGWISYCYFSKEKKYIQRTD